MKDLKPAQLAEIEAILGRPLVADELRPVEDLAGLSPAQLGVVRHLKDRQLVVCTVYLRAIAPVGVGEATRFLEDLGR